MTAAQYTDYQNRVAEFLKREGIRHMSTEGEPEFSWKPCECCGSHLGGDRYYANAVMEKKNEHGYHNVLDYLICSDCMYYNIYGMLDDSTMLEIEESMSGH